jgi:solute carrier family 10 (sodium/bile acid cotransporter), member 7
MNVGLYVFFTLFSLLLARPPIHPKSSILQHIFSRFSKRDTIAICFCAPAKSVSIGAPLIGVMWSAGFSNSVQSLVMVPIVLYQAEQILCGQVAVMLFRRWARDEWMPKNVVSDTETVTDVSSSETHLDEMETEEKINSEKTETKA